MPWVVRLVTDGVFLEKAAVCDLRRMIQGFDCLFPVEGFGITDFSHRRGDQHKPAAPVSPLLSEIGIVAYT